MKVREKNNQGRKGFTIVELVIVIGVIGVLSAVLIPTFIHLNKKAQDSSDTAFAKNANTALLMGRRTHKTMSEAIDDVVANSDISIDDFKTNSGNILVWDSVADRFAVVNEAQGVAADPVFAEGGALKATKNVELFRVYDDFDFDNDEQRYSIYASKNWNLSTTIIGTDSNPLKVGFDVGINDHFISGVYKRASNVDGQSVILNTGDCSALAFEVNSPKDDLRHFGNADSIHITAIAADACYYEWGAVTEPVVIESGKIILESGSDIVATVMGGATAEKAAGSSSSVEYQDHTPGSISAWRFPSFVRDYMARTASSRLDSINDIQSTPEPNRNNFYRNDDAAKGAAGGADLYMVGNDNTFEFPLYAIEINPTTLEEIVYKNPSTAEPFFDYVGETSGALPTWNAGVLDATSCAAGGKFSISIGTNVLNIEIVDGYNVTDAKGLSLADNVSSIVDGEGHFLARYDKWADLKKQYFGDNYSDLHPAALVQHGDIKLKNTDLPADLFWSSEQVETYLRENPGILKDYTDARNAGRAALGLEPFTELDVKRNLSGSMRDDTPVFYRATGNYLWNSTTPGSTATTDHQGYTALPVGWNGNFTYQGNYFGIDISALKQIAFFGTKEQNHNGSDITPETGEPMPDLNPEQYSLTEGSHGTLFGFNTAGGYAKNYLLPYRGWGGEINFKNLSVIGNGNRANDTKYQGGLFAFKVDATVANFSNVHISKAMGSFMSQIGFYTQNTFNTVMNIDRCKTFDSYSCMFYIYGTEHNTLTNSCAKNAGGPLIMLDERNRFEQYKNNGFIGKAPTLDCTNVYLENYVTGTEPFFASKPPKMVGILISQLMGQGIDVFGDLGGKNFTEKMSDGNTYMNFLVADMDIGGMAYDGSYETGMYATPSMGKFTVNNDGEDYSKNASMDLDLMTAGETPAPTLLGAYRQACVGQVGGEDKPTDSKAAPGMVFTNALGGHGMSVGQVGTKYVAKTINFNSGELMDLDNKLGQADYLSIYLASNFKVKSMVFGFVFGMK